MMRLPSILCQRCGRTVDEIVSWRNEAKATVVMTVRCHGDEDSMELSHVDLADAGLVEQLRGQQGVAFATPRIEPAAGRLPAQPKDQAHG